MQKVKVKQGSPEWHALRAAAEGTASEAPSVMNVSPFKDRSRPKLIKEKATGIIADTGDKSYIYGKGHDAEAGARPIAEEILGEDLYPVTAITDCGKYLASLDGLTFNDQILWEHKLWSEKKSAMVALGQVPEHDLWQIDHQFMVTGAKKCMYMISDGTEEKMAYCWVERDEDRIAQLMAGWEQFARDVAEYKEIHHEPEAVAQHIDSLPALQISIDGAVRDTNIQVYASAIRGRVQEISTDLSTDQEFADAEATVKFLKKAEDEIATVKKQALSQTATIEELFRTVDDLSAEMRAKRLELDKLIKARKEVIRTHMAHDGRVAVDDFVTQLNVGLGADLMPAVLTDFNGAMKGKRTLESLREAVDGEVARAKIDASQMAEGIRANLRVIEDEDAPHLFPDMKSLVLKLPEDLKAIIAARKAEAEKVNEQKQQKQADSFMNKEAEKAPAVTPKPRVTVSESTGETRPTIGDMIGTLAKHYQADTPTVSRWLDDHYLSLMKEAS